MLTQEIIIQLRNLFSPLENKIELFFAQSDHADQNQLVEMLNSVASTSPLLSVREDSQTSIKAPFPEFKILKNGEETGIHFKGIPNGHEFSSLVLAILNADEKGKRPDERLIQRIRNIRGPVRLQTYISLTCENCPDVVQALNQMATLHDEFTHTMIDGAYTQDQIQALGIQGVPSIVANGKLIHSGRITLIDLITRLEETFGTQKENIAAVDLGAFDVVVVGGGPAGASAAIYSARKGLKTAIIAEKMGGQVQETKGIENLISVLYTEGPALADQLQKHVREYPVTLLEHRRVKSISQDGIKKIILEDEDFLSAKSVIIATGAKWRELGVPGEKQYLGRGVAFCPHCDGPYYKGKKVAVIGGGNSGVEAAIDLAGIVREVVLIEFGDRLKADQVLIDKLKSLSNTSIVTHAKTKEIAGTEEKVTHLIYEDRNSQNEMRIDLDGVFVQIGLLPNTQFLKNTLELSRTGEIIIDEKGRTSVPGIYAAGDVTTIPYKQIIIAMGEGAKVALASFEDSMLRQ